MGRLRDIWRRWRRKHGRHRDRGKAKSGPRPPDAALPVTLVVPRKGCETTVEIASRDALRSLRSEFELLRLFAYGDSGDALRVLESAARTGHGNRFIELRDYLRDARHAGVIALCREIDRLFPSIAGELARDVLASEARTFRASVLAALREAPIEGHLEVAASYALSADLRPIAAAGGQVRSASDMLMTQPNDPKKSASANDSTGAASLEDALQAMESELQSLADIVSAPGVADEGLSEMLNGAAPEEPPVAEVSAPEAEEPAAVDNLEEIVDEVLLGEDAAPAPEASMPAAAAEAPLDEAFDVAAALPSEAVAPEDIAGLVEPVAEDPPAEPALSDATPSMAEAEVSEPEPLANEVDALMAALDQAEEALAPSSLLATDRPLTDVFADPTDESAAAEFAPAASLPTDVQSETVLEDFAPPPAPSIPPAPAARPAPIAPTPTRAPHMDPPTTRASEDAPQPTERPQASRRAEQHGAAGDSPREFATERPVRSRTRGRTSRSSRPVRGRGRSGEVENAIANLAEFLQAEVGGLWEEAQQALEDVVADASEVDELRARASELYAEMDRMQAELAAARKESRMLQAQLLNLRDEVAQAKQRAEMSAFDAQSAADRAKAAAREAETAARFHRES